LPGFYAQTQHQTLKALAALEGKTLKQYALERLFYGVADREKAHQELKTSLAQRLAEAQEGEVVEESIGEVAQQAMIAESGE